MNLQPVTGEKCSPSCTSSPIQGTIQGTVYSIQVVRRWFCVGIQGTVYLIQSYSGDSVLNSGCSQMALGHSFGLFRGQCTQFRVFADGFVLDFLWVC